VSLSVGFHLPVKKICRWFAALAALAVCNTLAAPPGLAKTADEAGVEETIAKLSSEQLEEMFTFLAGMTVLTLHQQASEMLVSELGLELPDNRTDAIDGLTVLTMLAADKGDMDVLLINAMVGSVVIASEEDQAATGLGEAVLDGRRADRVLCLLAGARPDVFGPLANDLGLLDASPEACPAAFDDMALTWQQKIGGHMRSGRPPQDLVSFVYQQPFRANDPLALFLAQSRLVENAAVFFDSYFRLPGPVTFEAASCGRAAAQWDPANRRLNFCYEMLDAFARIYLQKLTS